MTEDKLIAIVDAALSDMLCEGCDVEGNNEIFESCLECREQAMKEIRDRLKGSIMLGEKYPISDFDMSLYRINNEDMFSMNRRKG